MWKEKISKCFGVVDKRFAGHPIEENETKIVMKEALEAGANIEDIKEEFINYVKKEISNKAYLSQEIKKIENYFNKRINQERQ
jgi:hypothetical protein